MNAIFLTIAGLLFIAQLTLPRQWAFLPAIIAASHLSNLEILPELTPTRLLVLTGLARAAGQGFMVWPSREYRLDVLFVWFAIFAMLSSIGHTPDQWAPSPVANHAGLTLNIVGGYLYGRTYLPDIAAFRRFASVLPLILIPLAIIMLIQLRTERNLYSYIGAGKEESNIREDKIRAQGPFRGPITAGSLGATTLPLAFSLWMSRRRVTALIAFAACFGVVVTCNSSGPLAAVSITVASLILWRGRQYLGHLLWGIAFMAVLYYVIKGRGPWYIMASLDLVGGSTGYFRAELIDQGLRHIDEWWLCGTDYTRHWMPTGVSWSPNHTDIVNYYLHMGVIGGLPLTICLIGFIVTSFALLKRRMVELRRLNDPDELLLWRAGTALAAHAISFISISYFDQMYIFFYLLVGAIPGMVATAGSNFTQSPGSNLATQPESMMAKPLRYYS